MRLLSHGMLLVASLLGSFSVATSAATIYLYISGPTLSREEEWLLPFLSARSTHKFKKTENLTAAQIVFVELGNIQALQQYHAIPKGDVIKVLWSGENTDWSKLHDVLPHWDVFAGLALSHDVHQHVQTQYARLPLHFLTMYSPQTCWFSEAYAKYLDDWKTPAATAALWHRRPRNATFFANHLAYPRELMVNATAAALTRVDCGGKALHNIDWTPGSNKHELLVQSRFAICPENSEGSGYFTEKPYDSFISGSIPVYWAGKNTRPEPFIINPKRIILWNPEDPSAIKQRMLELINDLRARVEFFSEPFWQPSASKYSTALCSRFARAVLGNLDEMLKTQLPPPPSGAFPVAPLRVCNKTLHNLQSQEGQDQVVYSDFFSHLCGGVFLEMGAADGKSNSNSYAFEVDLDWSGLLIEANTMAFKMLSTRTERSRSVKVNGAVGDGEGNVTYIEIEGPQAQLSCVKEFASPEHLARIERDMHASGSDAHLRREVQIPMRPLDAWLQAHGVNHIHFFSLDVEGAELLVLKTLNFTRVPIDVITVEHNGKLQEIAVYLGSQGFILHKTLHLDGIFCSKRVCGDAGNL